MTLKSLLTGSVVFVFALVCMISAQGIALAEDDDLQAKVQNPVGNIYSLPFENTFDFGAPDGTAYILTVQPVIPVRIGNWNLINRVIAPLIYAPGIIVNIPSLPAGGTQGESRFGLGDINYTGFLSPANAGKLIWGVGPSLTMPTATDDSLGSKKWSGGASVVLLTQPKPWSLGILLRHLWSFAGDEDRADVNQSMIQPFVNYNLDKGWFLTTDPVILGNLDAPDENKWTVPLGGGFGRMFKIGKRPINTRLRAYYNVVRPEGAPDWQLQFTFQLIYPKS